MSGPVHLLLMVLDARLFSYRDAHWHHNTPLPKNQKIPAWASGRGFVFQGAWNSNRQRGGRAQQQKEISSYNKTGG